MGHGRWRSCWIPRSLRPASGEDEAGNIYFTSCECGYGQAAPNPTGSLWMLVAADQVPEGAEVAPAGQQQAERQDETEEIDDATPAP